MIARVIGALLMFGGVGIHVIDNIMPWHESFRVVGVGRARRQHGVFTLVGVGRARWQHGVI